MSLFYNPKTKKVQTWIYPAFVIVPVICIALVIALSRGMANQNKQNDTQEAQVDLFERIEKQ